MPRLPHSRIFLLLCQPQLLPFLWLRHMLILPEPSSWAEILPPLRLPLRLPSRRRFLLLLHPRPPTRSSSRGPPASPAPQPYRTYRLKYRSHGPNSHLEDTTAAAAP